MARATALLSRRRRLTVVSAALSAILCYGIAASIAGAQTVVGRVMGTVRDTSDAVVPGATLTLTQPSTGVHASTTTDADGSFEFSAVQPGEYELVVALEGFQTQKRPLTVRVATTLRADFKLPVAGVSSDVMVLGVAPVVRLTTSDIGEVISSDRIDTLPVNGRRFTDLVLLTNGTAVSASGTSDTPLLQTGLNLNVNGARPTHNNFAIDGVTATDYYFSNLSASTSVDAISEFKIQAGQYSAEFGAKGGGHVAVLTKSGSNTFTGTAFEFLRNDALDARNAFASKSTPVPPFKQNQFGFSAGGPGVKRRLFFFANYEGSRTRETITKLATVPTAAMRAGDFSGLRTIYDPLSASASGGRTPFAGNVIPSGRISNAARLLLETVPLPNLPGDVNNFRGEGARSRDDDQVNVRLDLALRGSDRIFARFSSNNISAMEPFGARGTNGLPGFTSRVTTKAQNAAFNYTRTLSERQVLNVLAGYNRVDGGVSTTNQALDIGGRAGILVLNESPANLRGVPAINTTFTTAFGDDLSNLERDNKTYQFSAQHLWSLGRHSLKYGGDVMRHRFAPYTPIFARGSYTFSGQYTASQRRGSNGNGLADFLLGYPSNATVLAGNAFEDARATWFGVFVQDDWRVSGRLTVNLGLRYDYAQPFHDTGNRLSTLDLEGRRVIVSSSDGSFAPEADFARFGAGTLPFVSSTDAGYPRSLVDGDKTNLGPRIGVAFAANSRTALRGGYSIVYSVPPLNLQARMDRNPPFSGLLQPVNTADPSFTIETAFASAASAPSFGIIARDFRNSRMQQWSAGVEHELPIGLGISAAYVGSSTERLDWMGPGNPATPCATGCAPLESRRVYPGLGNFTITRNDARARYDALQLRATQRAWRGLNYSAALTWGKSLDNSSTSSGDDNETSNNPFDLDADWGPSSYDRRVVFSFSYGYDLPFGAGRRFLNRGGVIDAVLGGWSLAGIVSAQSGNHFSVSIATCPANIGTACRANVTGEPNLPADQRTAQRWFDTSAFSAPAPGQFGNQGRNILVGPGYGSWDMSLQKEFRLPRGTRMQLRVQYFNVTNRVNYENPDRRFGAASIGAITRAKPARQGQVGVKLFF